MLAKSLCTYKLFKFQTFLRKPICPERSSYIYLKTQSYPYRNAAKNSKKVCLKEYFQYMVVFGDYHPGIQDNKQ